MRGQQPNRVFICQFCDGEFPAANNAQRYCVGCRPRRKNETQRDLRGRRVGAVSIWVCDDERYKRGLDAAPILAAIHAAAAARCPDSRKPGRDHICDEMLTDFLERFPHRSTKKACLKAIDRARSTGLIKPELADEWSVFIGLHPTNIYGDAWLAA